MNRTATATIALLLLSGVSGCGDALRRLPQGPQDERVVEVAMFEAGYGIAWHQKMAQQYTREHQAEGIRITLWGDQRVETIVKPRLLRGDPPDVVLVNAIPMWLLIRNHKAYPFDSVLDKPAYGAADKWRDTFIAGTLDTYASGGKVYGIPGSFGAWACWYNAQLFREHGWPVPKTWSEFDALCAQIQADGIAPVAFQGKYPSYAWFTYISLVQRCGGLAAINRINALEPGAFGHPDALWAARLVQDMALKHFEKGTMAMTHTESQLEFVSNRAALIFCGVWLENEMKKSIPPDFEMRCFNVPAVEKGKGNPHLFNGQGGEFYFVPANARHPELALDFLRYMISPANGPDMAATIGSLSPLKGGTKRELVSPALQSVLDMIEGAPGIFSERISTLFVQWVAEVMNPAFSALLQGDISPEEFGERLDQGIARIREHPDPDNPLPPYTPYAPSRFGEPL